MDNSPKTIDLTPEWESIILHLATAYANGSQDAAIELKRLARGADKLLQRSKIKDPAAMSEFEQEIVNGLRDRCFIVTIWTPEEVGDADINHATNRIIELGNDVLGALQ